ncbi:MAG: RluA family pseudouridine synthase [Planctomycetota bacterium]|nr:MAG: RluA family pseudouridine synthase [Planctomycetota bacterium]
MNSKPPHRFVHHVGPADSGQTLSAYLRERMEGASWSQVQKLVRSRHVMIHGNICTDAARRLKEGEVVKILPAAAAAPPQADDLRIVHLDDDVVVVDKPSGITTTRHAEERGWPAKRRQVQPTVDEMLPAVIDRLLATRSSSRKGPPTKPRDGQGGTRRLPPVRAVHRIDRETSGLLVFARSVPAERILAEQFRAHTTHRRYLAVCVGRVSTGTMISNLVRDRGDGRRGSSEDEEGKRSVTHVRPMEHFGEDYTLVECRLETGRTHQIRIHMAESGHPVCGERVYSAPRGVTIEDRSQATRVALHATELGFVHPVSGEELRFSSPLPSDISRLLKKLRGTVAGRRGRRPPFAGGDRD